MKEDHFPSNALFVDADLDKYEIRKALMQGKQGFSGNVWRAPTKYPLISLVGPSKSEVPTASTGDSIIRLRSFELLELTLVPGSLFTVGQRPSISEKTSLPNYEHHAGISLIFATDKSASSPPPHFWCATTRLSRPLHDFNVCFALLVKTLRLPLQRNKST
ncbi:hypothetical protein CC2G_000156 [Coprinopsis cinerea AmutBmut pab1-1]|nr:hypothetical protein CC2G_000156 [Coprinopsis cinerea AmutBmut pab1-1]